MAQALVALPETSAELECGSISYSRVRALTRVATAETEGFFLNIARFGTASQLEKVARYAKRGLGLNDPDRLRAMVDGSACDWYYDDDDGMLVLRARLMPDDGARLVSAITAMTQHLGSVPVSARRAMALAAVAEAAVAVEPRGSVPEIVVHVRTDDVPAEASAFIDEAVAIPVSTTERLCCDAGVVALLEGDNGEALSIGRRTRTIPSAIRRAMQARDQGCRFPGCTHTRFLHGHHVQHWARQGETSLSNLVTLCSFHHMQVHEGGFRVGASVDGAFEFCTPRGQRVANAPASLTGTTAALLADNIHRGIDVPAGTCDSQWDGSRVDYDHVMLTFFQNG